MLLDGNSDEILPSVTNHDNGIRQNCEQGSSAPSGANNGQSNQRQGTLFNPTKEPKKVLGI